MSPAGLEPAILANKWPQTHALERAATGTRFLAQISTDNPNVLLLFLSEVIQTKTDTDLPHKYHPRVSVFN